MKSIILYYFWNIQGALFSCGHLRLIPLDLSRLIISLLVDKLICLVKYYNINTQDSCSASHGSVTVPRYCFPDLWFGCLLDCAEGFSLKLNAVLQRFSMSGYFKPTWEVFPRYSYYNTSFSCRLWVRSDHVCSENLPQVTQICISF